MARKRLIEVYSAGCPICRDALERVRALACPSCEVVERDAHAPDATETMRRLGIARVPAVVIDGALASCCETGGIDEAALRAAGVGQPR